LFRVFNPRIPLTLLNFTAFLFDVMLWIKKARVYALVNEEEVLTRKLRECEAEKEEL